MPKRLRITSNGHPRDIQILTEEGVNLAPYCNRIEFIAQGGEAHRVILTALCPAAEIESECEIPAPEGVRFVVPAGQPWPQNWIAKYGRR